MFSWETVLKNEWWYMVWQKHSRFENDGQNQSCCIERTKIKCTSRLRGASPSPHKSGEERWEEEVEMFWKQRSWVNETYGNDCVLLRMMGTKDLGKRAVCELYVSGREGRGNLWSSLYMRRLAPVPGSGKERWIHINRSGRTQWWWKRDKLRELQGYKLKKSWWH